MAGLTTGGTSLNDLLSQARRLTSSALSLSAMFAGEASRLNRLDEALRLRTLYLSIKWQLERVKGIESAASYGHSQGKLTATLVGLAASAAVRIVSRNKDLAALTDYMFRTPASTERPFRLVMVCIGPKGLPDEAGVLSISELARKTNRPESEVSNILQEHGYLLFNENAFSLLIDRLIDDVLEGRLRLPVSGEKLAQITASSGIKPDAENQE